METNFFSQLHQIGCKQGNLSFKILDDNSMVVTFKILSDAKDNALHNIVPLKISGPIDELDREYFQVVTKPLQKAAGIVSSIEAYEIAMEKAEKESSKQKDLERAEAEKKKKAKEKLNEAKKILDAPDFSYSDDAKVKDVCNNLQNALKILPEFSEAKKLLNEVQLKQAQGELFN